MRFSRTGCTWRNGAAGGVQRAQGSDRAAKASASRLAAGFEATSPIPRKAGPLTRASDHVPNLDFDEAKEHQPAARTRLNADLSKNRVR